jgi:hypothetical protein
VYRGIFLYILGDYFAYISSALVISGRIALKLSRKYLYYYALLQLFSLNREFFKKTPPKAEFVFTDDQRQCGISIWILIPPNLTKNKGRRAKNASF